MFIDKIPADQANVIRIPLQGLSYFLNIAYAPMLPHKHEQCFLAIRQLGTSHTILSTDCGDPANPPWEEAMRQYLQFMLDHGMSSGEIRTMTRTLPAWLLGLEDAPKQ